MKGYVIIESEDDWIEREKKQARKDEDKNGKVEDGLISRRPLDDYWWEKEAE